MQSALTFPPPSKLHSLPSRKIALTWLCRLLVGATFIFSGMAKADDPWGSLYKVMDYIGVMHLDWVSPSLALAGVFLLFVLEFMTGVFLVTGSFRRFSPVMVLLFMIFMLPLTLWIAIANPVADCGCFGDAWIISNWATFWKNVGITLCGLWLLKTNRRVHWLVTPALQWILFLISASYISFIGFVGYAHQPPVDFREYKTGTPLVTPDASDDAHFVFIYEKAGVKREFAETDALPDEESGWKFVDRRQTDTAIAPVQRALRLWSPDGSEDVTADVAGSEGDKQMVLLIPSMKEVSIATTWKINELWQWASEHDIDFIAVAPVSQEDIEEWKDISMAEYPIYTSEDTSIKEVARGNPAVVYTENGNIVWKSTLCALPSDEKLQSTTNADMLFTPSLRWLESMSVIYLCIIAMLVMCSLLPKSALPTLWRPHR